MSVPGAGERGRFGCCRACATCLPTWCYAALLVLLNGGLATAGVFLVIFAVTFVNSAAGGLISREVYGGSLGMGIFLVLFALYGIVGPYLCRGAREEHLKYAYILYLMSMLVLLSFMTVCLLNAGDAENQAVMLQYGWMRAYAATPKRSLLSKAQTDGKCCGLSGPNDQAVAPCPAGATVGCMPGLRDSLRLHLSFAGILFGASAGGAFLLMGVTHGWIEAMNHARQQAAARGGSGGADDAVETQALLIDKFRPATEEVGVGIPSALLSRRANPGVLGGAGSPFAAPAPVAGRNSTSSTPTPGLVAGLGAGGMEDNPMGMGAGGADRPKRS